MDREIKTKLRKMGRISKQLQDLNLEVRQYIEQLNIPVDQSELIKEAVHEVIYVAPDILNINQLIRDVESGAFA